MKGARRWCCIAHTIMTSICHSGSSKTSLIWKISFQFIRYSAAIGKFYLLSCSPFLESGYNIDALNIYLAALSFCNFDRTPIISADTTFVESTRIVPCCDYIFYNIKQAKKEEICMEAKSKFGTRHVNIDGMHISSCF